MPDRARLRWRCRRGMKELDELLLRFLEEDYDTGSAALQGAFAELLERQDPELYALVCGRLEADDPATAEVVHRLRRAPGA